MNAYDYLFKYIVVGETGVGKSCLVLQFIQNQMKASHDVTVGVEFASKNVTVGSKDIKLQIWDTAGQENFRSITRSYYHSVIGALLVYDVTRRDTFDQVKQWLDEVKENGNPHMEILLVGNKNDLQNERTVTFEEGEAFAKKNKLPFIETNSKDHLKVAAAFTQVTQTVLDKISKDLIPVKGQVGIRVGEQEQAKMETKGEIKGEETKVGNRVGDQGGNIVSLKMQKIKAFGMGNIERCC